MWHTDSGEKHYVLQSHEAQLAPHVTVTFLEEKLLNPQQWSFHSVYVEIITNIAANVGCHLCAIC